jgi:cytochrome c-type biogenesis protein CcmH/NrfG
LLPSVLVKSKVVVPPISQSESEGSHMSKQESSALKSTDDSRSGWQGKHVYLMAVMCLALGVATGYFVRGSQSPVTPAPAAATAAAPANEAPPSLEQMKQMADKAAAPLLDRLKKDPKDFASLNEAGKVYRATHQFKEAIVYYAKALEIQPKNAAVRTDLASCLYYTGDVDGALAQLDRVLNDDPNFYGAMLNVGIIKLQAKNDANGAVVAWQRILKTNADPQFKDMVRKKIAATKQQAADKTGFEPKG